MSGEARSGLRKRLLWAAIVAAGAATFVVPEVSRAQERPAANVRCGIYFGEDSCPAQIPQDEVTRSRVRAFCGGLKEAADAVLSGARPGFRMQSGQEWWQGEVSENRVMWGNIRGRGIYTYDATATSPQNRYELAFFFPGVSVAELEEGLTICPAFFTSVTGTASTPILFHRHKNDGDVQMIVSAQARQYNPQSRTHESGALISLDRE